MENKIVLLDTCILIDYFRKQEKSKTRLLQIVDEFELLCISSITVFEIYAGATLIQLPFWEVLLEKTTILNLDAQTAHVAVRVLQQMKQKRKSIEKADLFIAAAAMNAGIPMATLNRKHFEHIDGLKLL